MVTLQVIDIFDTTTKHVGALPFGKQAAGYTTGAGVAWTAAQFAAHTVPFPAVRIDQDAHAADPTADLLDVEIGAATIAEIPLWLTLARKSFNNATRPGQRWPGIYCGLRNLNAAINVIKGANLTNVPFGIPDLTNRTDAINKVSTATGSFPRVWQQYAFGGTFDSGIVSVDWLQNVSRKADPPVIPQVPPGQWKDPKAWTWKLVTIIGEGLDGHLYLFTYNAGTGLWTGPTKLGLCLPLA